MTSFIVEDGTGLDTATSLVSVAFADDYFALRGNATWAALSDSDKEKHLVLASDYIEYRYSAQLISERLVDEQALSFPRDLVVEFPDRVKKAVCEYAILSVAGTLLSEPVLSGGQMIKRKRERFIQVEEEVHYEINRNGKFIPHPIADALIAPYLRKGGRAIR